MVTINNKQYDENTFSEATRALYETLLHVQKQEREIKAQLYDLRETAQGLSTALTVAAQVEEEHSPDEES